MAFRYLPSCIRVLGVLLALAAGRPARGYWMPLEEEIANRSREAWVVAFGADARPKLGYALGAGEVAGAAGDVVLPPGAVMRLYADSLRVEEFALSDRILLRDHGRAQGEVLVRLDVDHLSGLSRFSGVARKYGPVQAQFVMMTPRALSIVEAGPGGAPEGEEGKGLAAGPAAPAAGGDLPPLMAGDREAGAANPFHYYTTGRIRKDPDFNLDSLGAEASLACLHQRGNLMPPELLADYFFNTLFQYYVRRFMGYDPNLNYDQYPTLKPRYFDELYRAWLDRFCAPRGVRAMPTPDPGGDFRAFVAYRRAFETSVASLQRNRAFVSLGIAYMRQKILVEKLQGALQGHPAAATQKLLLERDRLAEDLQTMIFHWMDEAFTGFVGRFKAAPAEAKEEAGALLETFRPAFLARPRYAAILAGTRDSLAPVAQVDGVELPAAAGVMILP